MAERLRGGASMSSSVVMPIPRVGMAIDEAGRERLEVIGRFLPASIAQRLAHG